MKNKLIIFGNTEFAEIAYEYFTHDSDYEVVAFCVHRVYINKEEIFGLPLVAFEDIVELYAPAEHAFFGACVYTKLNRLRTQVYLEAKAFGYEIASYVSSYAFVWRNVKLGEHVFISENVVLQPFVEIGRNVVFWSGSVIAHHSKVLDNCFIASHSVINGGVVIGKNCFLGANSNVNNGIVVSDDCFVSSGGMVLKNLPEDCMVRGKELILNASKKYFEVID